MAFGYRDPALHEWAEKLEPVRQVLAFFNAPDIFVILTWLDADPDAIREKARLLAAGDGSSAYSLLTAATTQINSRVSAVDTAWKGQAADEFVRYMGAVKLYGADVLSRVQKTAQAGMDLANAVQKFKDDSIAYLGQQFLSVILAIGEIGALAAAGAVIGAPAGGVGAVPGAAIGAIVGIIVSILNFVQRGLARIGELGKLFNGLDTAVPNATGELNQAQFAETETGFDDPTDVTRQNWQPTAS